MLWYRIVTNPADEGHGDSYEMAYEYPTTAGMIRLLRVGQCWAIEFDGCSNGRWHSPDDAVSAVACHRTGLAGWDQAQVAVPDDLLRWRPLGDSL
jgi:hypothetical protein